MVTRYGKKYLRSFCVILQNSGDLVAIDQSDWRERPIRSVSLTGLYSNESGFQQCHIYLFNIKLVQQYTRKEKEEKKRKKQQKKTHAHRNYNKTRVKTKLYIVSQS